MNTKNLTTNKLSSLIQKYDVPCPRYTSYPTVPYWENNLNEEEWKNLISEAFKKSNSTEGISLYIHLPFCEALCTYCACNKRITKNHNVEEPYIEALIKEWTIYRSIFSEAPNIKEIHLGGGTPTFFSPENLTKLIKAILKDAHISTNPSFSVEVHPNHTTIEHLKALADLGFKRLSVGIQDFDVKVQYIINRLQSFEQTKYIFDSARKLGYNSINADIIYGLPLQTQKSIQLTIDHVKELRPERIAFYSYAHVPWKSKGQRRYTEADLPQPEEKRALYELGKEMLLEAGYKDLGMDHFALPSDELYKAFVNKNLHRNFMGYTTEPSKLLIGMGASSIGDCWNGFMQNVKEVEEYEKIVSQNKLPIFNGHYLNEEDLIIRKHILNLICLLETTFTIEELNYQFITDSFTRLKDVEDDGLATISENKIKVTETGKGFLRNICMCFDERLMKTKPETKVFSRSI